MVLCTYFFHYGLKQKLNLNEKDYANYGLYVLYDNEERGSAGSGVWLPENIQLSQTGVHAKVHLIVCLPYYSFKRCYLVFPPLLWETFSIYLKTTSGQLMYFTFFLNTGICI